MSLNRPSVPPTMEFFSRPRPRGGDWGVSIELSSVRLALEGLDAALAERLQERYAPYSRLLQPGGAAPTENTNGVLRVSLGRDDRDYFIDPPEIPEDNPVLLACDAGRVRYLGYRVAGWFDAPGELGEIVLARGEYEPDLRAIENFVRAAVAWRAVSLGGALVHSASAVWKGNGYLFYGPSGAGKSTLSACNRRARILSDDLSLVLPAGNGGLDVVGSPFRGTYTGGPPVVGRFPLCVGFRIVKAPHASIERVPRVRAFAELVANLPFLVDALPARPDLFETFERTFAPLPLHHLLFRKDDSYWDAIEAADMA